MSITPLIDFRVGLLRDVNLACSTINDWLIWLRDNPWIPPNYVTLILLRNGPLCLLVWNNIILSGLLRFMYNPALGQNPFVRRPGGWVRGLVFSHPGDVTCV